MQKVHFSITPVERTVTSGLSCKSSGRWNWASRQLKRAHLVRAVVGAVAGADAAVVDLRVQALGGVIGRVDRADRLARRVRALLAEHRQEADVELAARLVAEVALDPDPAHVAPLARRVAAHHRDVVLGVAGDHARLAAGAPVEVDRHRPAVLGVREAPAYIFAERSGRCGEGAAAVTTGTMSRPCWYGLPSSTGRRTRFPARATVARAPAQAKVSAGAGAAGRSASASAPTGRRPRRRGCPGRRTPAARRARRGRRPRRGRPSATPSRGAVAGESSSQGRPGDGVTACRDVVEPRQVGAATVAAERRREQDEVEPGRRRRPLGRRREERPAAAGVERRRRRHGRRPTSSRRAPERARWHRARGPAGAGGQRAFACSAARARTTRTGSLDGKRAGAGSLPPTSRSTCAACRVSASGVMAGCARFTTPAPRHDVAERLEGVVVGQVRGGRARWSGRGGSAKLTTSGTLPSASAAPSAAGSAPTGSACWRSSTSTSPAASARGARAPPRPRRARPRGAGPGGASAQVAEREVAEEQPRAASCVASGPWL